ncbi:C3a anaphylatoxin chemotactic receptor isoform X1 [Python bivittatus]|uniref:C3a anaphylatoxin chemotactic receptor n=1 Tax=Python bivittatus TaxID=176946 RepID=A0A9F2WBU7_PYTBI|nr:C3a anaphylatoxin chemotactic receptor isoform X1 [Python bivittatus]XP_025027693.1 C3a anaphylatoxin chemotactic receptor isoform X1 [Python bivittatus]
MAPLPGNESLNENSDPFLLPSTSVSSLIIFSITFLLGFSGNSLVIWVIVLKMTQTVNTVWFLHLAIADLVCCLSLPFSIAHLALHEYWPFGWFFCKIIPSAIILNMFASVFLLTAISIDRCLLVMKPVWCQNHRTVRFATMICSGIWILAFIMCCPAFFYRETLEDEFGNIKCVNNWNMGKHDEYEWLDDLLTIEMMPTEHPTLAAEGIYEGIFTSGILDPRPAYAIVNSTKRNTALPLGVSHHYGIERERDLLMTVVTHPPSGLYKFPRIRLSTPTASIFQLDDQSASNHTMEMNFHDDFPKTQLPSVLVSITITRTLFGFLLPFAVMTTCYTLIGQMMFKKRLVGPRRKAMQVILLVVATFFLCWAPYHLSGVLFLLAPPQTPFHQALLLWDSVFIALAYANSCINPLLYVFVGQNFREKVRQTVQEIFEGAFSEPSSPVCSQDRSKTTTVDHDMETSVV